jgi:hypothetical protein
MKLKRLGCCFHLLLSTLICAFAFPAQASPPLNTVIGVDRIEDNTIYFSSPNSTGVPKPLKPGLFDMSYQGSLTPPEGQPYFIFSGKPCQNCLEEKNIYAIRPSGGKPTSFVYPGKIVDPKNRGVLWESRAFFGRCLARKGDVLVVFQKEKIDRKKSPQASVLIVEAAPNYLAENLIERHLPSISSTLQMVKRKQCHEIDGRNRLMLSKPLDLHPHANTDSEEDEDTEHENESDTGTGEKNN